MPSRGENSKVSNAYAAEKSWKDDMPAYRRLRREGLQPRTIEGSAYLETKATDRLEIEDGKLYGDKLSLVKDVKSLLPEVK